MDRDFNKQLMDLIKERRSVRLFKGEKIRREDILSIIEAGIWAPTGCNNQELRFLILDKEEDINEFVKFKRFLRGVSAVILIFCDMSLPMSNQMYHKYKHERHLPYVDAGLALANMILYAKSKGIDSCIINLSKYHFRRSEERRVMKRLTNKVKRRLKLYSLMESNFEFYLRNYLKLPEHLRIMCGVVFGFGEKYPDVKTCKHGGRRIMRQDANYYILSR